jgi:hypothetical protein
MTQRKWYVYVIGTDGGDAVKVGTARDVIHRIRVMQSGNPRKLRVLASWEHERACDVEVLAHRMLADYRALGEWFFCSSATAERAVTDAISNLQDGGPSPTKATGVRIRRPDLIPGISQSGHLIVMENAGQVFGVPVWKCACHCGHAECLKETTVRSDYLKYQRVKSCGARYIHVKNLHLTRK